MAAAPTTGFVEYRRATDRGPVNQGWKDSFDGINRGRRTLAAPPIALAEVQAYVYAAYTARVELADLLGDQARAPALAEAGGGPQGGVQRAVWMPLRQAYAVALDGAGTRSTPSPRTWATVCGAATSTRPRPRRSPGTCSGRGCRPVSACARWPTTWAPYNPMSYHNGSMWPHDSAIAAAGVARYGYRVEAQWIDVGLLDAAQHTGQRLPELFCGFDRAEFDSPVPYPTSCAPQAWAAAAPLLLVRSLLGLNPDVPAGVVRMAPAAPERMLPLRVERIRLAGARVDVEVRADGWTVRRAAGRGAARRRSARLIRRDMSCARGSTCRCDVSASGRRDACSGIDTSRGDRVAGGRDQTTDSAERAGERCVERAGSQGAAPDRAAAGRRRPQARGQDVAGTARQPSRWLRNFRNPVIAAVLLSAVVCPAVGAVGAGLAAALFAGVLVWARRSLACGVVPLRLRGWWWAGSG